MCREIGFGGFDLRGVCGGKNDDERERRKRGVKELERIGKGSCGDPEMGIVERLEVKWICVSA